MDCEHVMRLDQSRPIRVMHVINALETAGAQTMLLKLLGQSHQENLRQEVTSLVGGGALWEAFCAEADAVWSMGMRAGWAGPSSLLRLRRHLVRRRPDVVVTWLYHADLLGGISAGWRGQFPVVWNVRHSRLDPSATKRRTMWTARACAALSASIPSAIVFNSEEGRRLHVDRGYAAAKSVVIANGFDIERFRPNRAAGIAFRRELGATSRAPIVAMVARFDRNKDHANFFAAAKRIREHFVDARFVLCGSGVDERNADLVSAARRAGVEDACSLLGPRTDVERVFASADVVVSASISEGFPTVIGEAMACGVPCVATRVGDTEAVVGKYGRLVAPRDPAGLASACLELLTMDAAERAALGRAARNRIESRFGMRAVATEHYGVWQRAAWGMSTPMAFTKVRNASSPPIRDVKKRSIRACDDRRLTLSKSAERE